MLPPTPMPAWATDQVNILVPSAEQQATGWRPGQTGVSGYDNWWKNVVYLWIVWLRSLFDSAANMFLPGNLTVGGQPFSFAEFTYSVSASTDQLTKAGHGLQTGDGPVRTANSGGALPGGLAATVDYWVIAVDVDHLRLATSFANAIAGVAVDVTSNGSGLQVLRAQTSTTRASDVEVTRNLTVDGALAVDGALTLDGTLGVGGSLNAGGVIFANAGIAAGVNQNIAVSGTGKYLHGTKTLSISPLQAVVATGGAAQLGVIGTAGGGTQFTNVITIVLPLTCIVVGTQITAIRSRIVDSAGTTYQLRLTDSVSVVAVSTAASAGNGSSQVLPISGLTYLVAASNPIQVQLLRAAGTGTVNWISVDVDYNQPPP